MINASIKGLPMLFWILLASYASLLSLTVYLDFIFRCIDQDSAWVANWIHRIKATWCPLETALGSIILVNQKVAILWSNKGWNILIIHLRERNNVGNAICIVPNQPIAFLYRTRQCYIWWPLCFQSSWYPLGGFFM